MTINRNIEINNKYNQWFRNWHYRKEDTLILTCKLGNEIINCYDGTHNKKQFFKKCGDDIEHLKSILLSLMIKNKDVLLSYKDDDIRFMEVRDNWANI